MTDSSDKGHHHPPPNKVDNRPPPPQQQDIDAGKGNTSVRVMGVFILIIEVGLLFVYGFEGNILNEVGSWGGSAVVLGTPLSTGLQGLYLSHFQYIFYFITLIFTIIAFGCLYAANAKTTLSGFFLSFFIVGFTTIWSPVVQKFWYNVFTGGFITNQYIITTDPTGRADYMHYESGGDLWLSFNVMRISLLNAISQLVVFYGAFHKLNVGQVFFLSFWYQAAWTLNYHLNVQVSRSQPDGALRFMDDYAINQVFLFGAVFGLIICLLNKKPPVEDLRFGKYHSQIQPGYPVVSVAQAQTQLPLITSLIGTFLLYISFMGIAVMYPIHSVRSRFFWSEGFMNILFALSACVFTIMFLTAAMKQRFGLRQIHFGMIGGAIICGPIAGTLDNIGAMMALGTFAGIIAVLYFKVLHPRINRTRVFDTYGIVYILIISFLGTMFIAPLVLRGMYNHNVLSNTLNNVVISSSNVAGWSLVYVGISIGVALISGLLIGLFLKCFGKEIYREYDDENTFVPKPGLYDDAYLVARSRIQDTNQTATHLRTHNYV